MFDQYRPKGIEYEICHQKAFVFHIKKLDFERTNTNLFSIDGCFVVILGTFIERMRIVFCM